MLSTQKHSNEINKSSEEKENVFRESISFSSMDVPKCFHWRGWTSPTIKKIENNKTQDIFC